MGSTICKAEKAQIGAGFDSRQLHHLITWRLLWLENSEITFEKVTSAGIIKRREMKIKPGRLVKINSALSETDLFHRIEDVLSTVKARYNFGNDFELIVDSEEPLERYSESLYFTYRSILLLVRKNRGLWTRYKKNLKRRIDIIYKLLSPGGILLTIVPTNYNKDIPLQVYTFCIGNMLYPLEELIIHENSGIYYDTVYGKILYPRDKGKYCTTRLFKYQPYNICTASPSELDERFHNYYSAFQNKSISKWLATRLLSVQEKAEMAERDRSRDMEDLFSRQDPWSKKIYIEDSKE